MWLVNSQLLSKNCNMATYQVKLTAVDFCSVSSVHLSYKDLNEQWITKIKEGKYLVSTVVKVLTHWEKVNSLNLVFVSSRALLKCLYKSPLLLHYLITYNSLISDFWDICFVTVQCFQDVTSISAVKINMQVLYTKHLCSDLQVCIFWLLSPL